MNVLPFDDYCNAFISQIINISHRKYCIGFVQQRGLEIIGQWIIDYSISKDGGLQRYEYNLKTKELKLRKKDKDHSDFTSLPIPYIQSNSIIHISNHDMRCGGVSLNNALFGHACVVNESNELTYLGVVIDDKKECFGIEFYPSLGIVEYIGCYSNNERHGFGMLYNCKGELVYEGDYWFGSTKGELVNEVTVKRIENDNNLVHSLIRKLVIVEGCGNEILDGLELYGYDNLESVKIEKNSFMNIAFLRISDNDVLNSIVIEGDDCGYGAFNNVKSVVIESDMIYD